MYADSMKKEAWAIFRMPIIPNTMVSPDATRKSSIPYASPCTPWATYIAVVGSTSCLPGARALVAGLALVLAAREAAVHLREHELGRDHHRRADARGPLVPVIRRDVEGLPLLRWRDVFLDVEILDRLVVACAHRQDFAVEELVAVALPDLDDLLGVGASRPLHHAQQPVRLLDVGPDVSRPVLVETGVVGRRPLRLPERVPGLVHLDLARRLEEAALGAVLAHVHEPDRAVHADAMEHVRLVEEEVRERQRDAHLPGLDEEVLGVGDPVAGEDDLGGRGLDLLEV